MNMPHTRFRSLMIGGAFAAVSAFVPAATHAQESEIFQTHDLTTLPCAGKKATLYMSAKDALDQRGESKHREITLPARKFSNPANPFLAEQRCALSLDSNKAKVIATTIGDIIRENTNSMPDKNTVERLLIVQNVIATSNDENVLEQSLEDLWSIMLQLEEDILSTAERKLRQAERDLRDAMDRNATQEEIKQKSDALEDAMKDALAERAGNTSDPQTKQELEDMKKLLEKLRELQNELGKNMSPEMLQKMAQQMQQNEKGQSSKKGGKQESMKEMLEKMKKQLEKMQKMKHLQEKMKELDDLAKEQKELRDKTSEQAKQNAIDIDAVREKLEELTRMLDENIEKEIKREFQKRTPPSSLRDLSPIKAAFEETANTAPDNNDRIMQLERMDKSVEDISGELEQARKKITPLTEDRARDMTEELGRIQKELEGDETDGETPQPPQKKPQDGKPQDQQKQSDLLEQIRQMLEKKKKGQKQQQNGDQDDKKKSGDGQKQQDLQERLQKMLEDMKKKGMDPGKLDDAEKSMGDASESLDQGEPGDAVPSQDKALESMQETMEQMQKLAQEMQESMSNGNEPNGSSDPSVLGNQKDVMGAKGGNNPETGIKPDTLEQDNLTSDIREQIRKRLENPALLNRDYLERLNRQGRPPAP